MQSSIKYKSSPNIALIKYWGKFDEDYILPINDSIGLTLNSDDISTITLCEFSKTFSHHQFWLNGQSFPINHRMVKILQLFKEKAHSLKYSNISAEQWDEYHFKIQSSNSFPTASGMASSASGFSCLAIALNGLFQNILTSKQISQLARLGSGSAARSVFEGLVLWRGISQQLFEKKGKVTKEQLQKASKICLSETVIDEKDLKYIRILALLTDNKQKDVSSTSGMKLSTETSQLISQRNKIAKTRISIVMEHMERIKQARNNKQKEVEYEAYSKLAEIIIRDSNQFHAICLDTYPPIFYLNQFSRQVMHIVDHIINKKSQKTKVAYSFDAGAHAFLFVHEDMIQEVLAVLIQFYSPTIPEQFFNKKAFSLVQQIHNQKQLAQLYPHIQLPPIHPTQIWLTDVGIGAHLFESKND